jgi:hypothetical protein
MQHFLLVDRISEKLLEANIRGCQRVFFVGSNRPSFCTCAGPNGGHFGLESRRR